MIIKDIFTHIMDAIFPAHCVLCSCEGNILCKSCQDTLDPSGVFFCPGCHIESKLGVCCGSCQSAIDRHIALYYYSKDIASIIKACKYGYQEGILPLLAPQIKEFFFGNTLPEVDVICPIPLHPKRLAERGFNQAVLIANELSNIYTYPVQELLYRKKQTVKQSTLDLGQRQKNISTDTFRYKSSTVPRRVMLVDDVFTTGATMQSAAKVLKQQGVTYVLGVSLARSIDINHN